jgi:PBP1b-binding outer membrane lipoprotein LpoB
MAGVSDNIKDKSSRSNTMQCKKWFFLASIIMIIVMLSGCAQMENIKKKQSFSNINNAYRNSILWSDFEYALSFQKKSLQDQVKLDPMYKKIKVTAYDEKRHVVNSNATQIDQTVHIQYFWIDQMLEKSIIVYPVWEWDAHSQNWYLISEPPVFE